MANFYHFRLDGMEYTLKSDHSTEHMEAIVALAEEKINAIREACPAYSGVRASTLAALQLAEELLAAREENEQMFAEAKTSANSLRKKPGKKYAKHSKALPHEEENLFKTEE